MSDIIPIDKTLYDRVIATLKKNCLSTFSVQHHIIDRFIINTCHGIRECIEFNEDDIIIDGFITGDPTNDFHYHGKTVYELLGGNSINKIANPIDVSNYIVPPWYVENHPYKQNMYELFPSIKHTIMNQFRTGNN